jgi:hypothetical protein
MQLSNKIKVLLESEKNLENENYTNHLSNTCEINKYYEKFKNFYNQFIYKYCDCDLTNNDYLNIIDDFVLKRMDKFLVSKSMNILFWVCFLNYEKTANYIKVKRIKEKDVCKLLKISWFTIKKISLLYKKLKKIEIMQF